MTSSRGTPGTQTETRTSGAPADHSPARSRVPGLARQRLRRTSHVRGGADLVSSVDRPRPVLQPAPPTAAPTAEQPAAPTADGQPPSRAHLRAQVGGARLLGSDITLGFILLNEARYRAFELVGVPRDQANLATFVAILMAADRLEAAQRALQSPPRPSRADAILGLAAGNEALKAIGGAPMRQHPLLGPLVGFALLSATARPVLQRSMHGIRTATHDLRLSYRHRYGHRAPRTVG